MLKCQETITTQQETYQIALYQQNYFKLIEMSLSRQTNTTTTQQINFTKKLEEDDGATIFFYCRKAAKTILNLDSLIVTEWNK